MPKTRDFGSGESEAADDVYFTLRGQRFDLYPELPGNVMWDIENRLFQDPSNPENLIASNLDVIRMIKGALKTESRERFNQLLVDNPEIGSAVLGDIYTWMMEAYAGRPTDASGR